MPIYDAYGRPVKTRELTEELASPGMASVRQVWHDTVASGLTPSRLGAILMQVDQNQIYEYLTLAEEMEERDLHYASVIGTRKLAVGGLEVQVESKNDDAKSNAIVDFIKDVVTTEEFDDLVFNTMDALGKGFSVSEIMWERSENQWAPRCYERRDQRWFQFDQATGSQLLLRDDNGPPEGIPLAPYKFVQHRPKIKTGLPIRGGLARLAVVAFMCKGYTLKDWLAFIEVFGMPLRVGKYTSAATPDQKAALLRAVSMIGTDAACIIPEGMEIDFVAAANATGGDKLFQGMADWLDKQVSKGVLGQTMTVDDGSSLAQAKVHAEVREDIKISDAKQLASALRRDLIKPLVDLNFGPQKKNEYPVLRFTTEEQEDLEVLSRSLPPFINLGLRVEESVIRDKFGLPEPEEGAVLLKAASKPAAEDPGAKDNGKKPEPDAKDPETEATVDDATQEAELAGARRQALLALTRKVVAGETLTADQRRYLALAASGRDAIDEEVDETLDGWRKAMDPVLDPITELAQRSTSVEDFLAKAAELHTTPEALVRALATLTFKGRALGDVTDEVR